MEQLWKKMKELSFFLTSLQMLKPFPKRWVLDSSKLKEFADDIFNFNETGRNLS